jgi:hypothetical protein
MDKQAGEERDFTTEVTKDTEKSTSVLSVNSVASVVSFLRIEALPSH